LNLPAEKFLLPFLAALTWTVSAAAQEGAPSGENFYSLSYEYYGRAPYPITSRGARVGFLPAGGSEVEISHVRSEYSVLLTSFTFNETTLIMRSKAGSYIAFSGGLGYRQADLETNVFLRSEDPDLKPQAAVSEEFKAITVNFGLGCEIPLSRNFLLGFDLFSVSSPIYAIKKTDNFPDNSAEYEEDPKSLPFIRDGLGTSYQMARSFIKVRL
jgi:hypothetical protein